MRVCGSSSKTTTLELGCNKVHNTFILLNNLEYVHFSTTHPGSLWLPSTNEAPHLLFLGATTQQDTVVFTLVQRPVGHKWLEEQWPRSPTPDSCGAAQELQRHTLMSPCEIPLPLQHFRPGPQVINRIPGEADVKLFEAQSNYFVHRALPPWGDSRMSQMRTRPSSEELAKMLSFTGLTDKPYTASS